LSRRIQGWESGELAISLNVLLRTTRFNEAEAHARRMRESIRPTRAEAQHKIAATYEVNQERISENLSGKRFPAAKRLAQNSQYDLDALRG
jgi:hypothetical protein